LFRYYVIRCFLSSLSTLSIAVIPKKDFVWKEWSEKKRPETRCEAAARMGGKGKMLEDLSVGLLTHEPRSFAESMESYERHGFFDIIPEFLIYINNKRDAVVKVAEEYQRKYPGKIKIMGSEQNQGITRGMLALTAAATKPYFLFMERDFYLIEPQTCVYEELQAGIDLIKQNAAHVVRYRHKWHAGRPNWAYRFFAGHEEDAFRGWQPNLGCNVHYWLEDPVKSFPQYFWTCGEKPDMVCSDSYYCNWTNNPQLWAIDWWNREYVEGSFKNPVRLDPYDNLESWFNWDPNAWNERRFVIAQGMGLFKHRDLGNIVHV
jgi:Glycosyl transferase family 2